MARRRAPSTKNVYMMWNTCNKRKKRLRSVIVRLVSPFLIVQGSLTSVGGAWIGQARSSKKRWSQFLSTRFKSRLYPSSRQVAYHEGFPKKKKKRGASSAASGGASARTIPQEPSTPSAACTHPSSAALPVEGEPQGCRGKCPCTPPASRLPPASPSDWPRCLGTS